VISSNILTKYEVRYTALHHSGHISLSASYLLKPTHAHIMQYQVPHFS